MLDLHEAISDQLLSISVRQGGAGLWFGEGRRGLQPSVQLDMVGTSWLLLKWPLGMFTPEKQFLVAVINAARRALPANSKTPPAKRLWRSPRQHPQQGHWVLSPSQRCRLRLWDVQGYLAEQSASNVEHKVNAFAIWIQPLVLVCFIQMCRHPIAVSHSEEGYIIHLWDWQWYVVGFGGVLGGNSCKFMHVHKLYFIPELQPPPPAKTALAK